MTGSPGATEIAFSQSTSVIFGLEAAAVVLEVYFDRPRLQGQSVTVYIDNNAALSALINWGS